MTQTFRVFRLPGDGVGPEVVDEACSVLEAVGGKAGVTFEFTDGLIGGAAIDYHGKPLSEGDLQQAKGADAVFLGAVGGPKWDHMPKETRPEAGLLGLRKELGLFANLRPVKVFDALASSSPLKDDIVRGADLMVVRELTGGLYFGQPSNRKEDDTGRSAVDT
ncbi:MAG: isocitrate/isopropylmalate family dehydrogenase, partial [Thermomicrobiaceae bacterium]